jgi:hypothetical protein
MNSGCALIRAHQHSNIDSPLDRSFPSARAARGNAEDGNSGFRDTAKVREAALRNQRQDLLGDPESHSGINEILIGSLADEPQIFVVQGGQVLLDRIDRRLVGKQGIDGFRTQAVRLGGPAKWAFRGPTIMRPV